MPAAVTPGTIIDHYLIEGVLGAGSMGDVYRGKDINLERRVAIKILSDKHRDNDELRARFVREGRAVAKISHPNVVQVFMTGEFDDRPYIAMEFLDGIDLDTAIEDGGPWNSLRAARAIQDAAQGLEAAAKAGLIHRDVKPSNLVQLTAGGVKVTDFGLAKPVNPGNEPALTAMGVVVGTPDYIAPEQARGDPIDERVDIYALGGTLYYLLTAIPPFRTGRPADDKYLKVVARHLREPPPDARVRAPDVDDELAELTLSMMAKKPVDRPGYAELVEQLGAVGDRLERVYSTKPTRGMSQSSRPTPSRPAPTPFVGGDAPKALPDAIAARRADDLDEAAPTNVRIPTGAHDSQEPPRSRRARDDAPAPKVSRVLIATTVISALVFFAGLGLMLFGPMPETAAPAIAPDGAPSATPDAATAAAPSSPTIAPDAPKPPPGMLLVRRPDGAPWLFVDAAPVTHGDYAALFPRQKKPSKRLDPKPVTGVSYDYAVSFARAKGKRLLTAAEWDAAASADGFTAADGLYEWIQAIDDGGERLVKSKRGDAKRRASGGKDVGFRLALDLEAAASP